MAASHSKQTPTPNHSDTFFLANFKSLGITDTEGIKIIIIMHNINVLNIPDNVKVRRSRKSLKHGSTFDHLVPAKQSGRT